MLHVTTKVGEVGKEEREKRHFPIIHNEKGVPTYPTHGRRYIPHGYCRHDDTIWRPHAEGINPKYTVNGPDWVSKLRYIDAPKIDKRFPENEIFPKPWFSLRTYPGFSRPTEQEWSYYTNGYHNGKVTKWEGKHKASEYSRNEVTYDMILGNNKKEFLIEKRNDIACASGGDKPYQAVEYSIGFHGEGSTRPVVNFGGPGTTKPHTFVPLQNLPPMDHESFRDKERRRRLRNEINVVQSLEDWRPATPLLPPPHEEIVKK